MFPLICLLLAIISMVTLYLVLRYRVHVHITYTPYGGKSRSRYVASMSTVRSGHDGPHQFPTATPRRTGKAPAGPRKGPAAATGSPEPGYSTRPKLDHVARPYVQVDPREATGTLANRPSTPRVSDIQSALVNLGCDRKRARQVAETVCSQAPAADLETLIRMALQEVQRAA